MEVEPVEAELLTALHFVEERCPGFGQAVRIGASQVDQVTVVRKYLRRRKSPLFTVLPKCGDRPRRQRGATHWRWFLVNSAKALAPIAAAFIGAFSTPPRCTDVRSEIFHSTIPPESFQFLHTIRRTSIRRHLICFLQKRCSSPRPDRRKMALSATK